MKCICGYDFNEPADRRNSSIVVRDKDYRVFLKKELKIIRCRDGNRRLGLIAQNSVHAGTMHICPHCKRLVLRNPDGEDPVYYDPVSNATIQP